MKIVLAIESLASFGGAQRAIIHIAKLLCDEGLSIGLWTFDRSRNQFYYPVPAGISVLTLGEPYTDYQKTRTWLPRMLRRIKFLSQCLEEERVQVVISFMDLMNIQFIGAKWLSRIKLIICERSNPRFRPLPLWWHMVRECVYPLADKFIVQTKGVTREYSNRIRKNIRVIPNPISEKMIDFEFSQRQKRIIAVGRLREVKGFHDLIRAFSILSPDVPEWSLCIIGDGPLKESLSGLIDELNLGDKITLVGAVEDVSPFYKTSRMFVLSSYWEGFPNALAEAMSYGLACISSDCRYGPETLLSKDSGLIFPAGNIHALADCMSKLIHNDHLMETLAKHAREKSLQFSDDKVVLFWKDLIREVSEHETT